MLSKHKDVPEMFQREAKNIATYWKGRGKREGGEHMRKGRAWTLHQGIIACFILRTKMITGLMQQYWNPRTSAR